MYMNQSVFAFTCFSISVFAISFQRPFVKKEKKRLKWVCKNAWSFPNAWMTSQGEHTIV